MALQLNPYLSNFDKSFKESQTRNYVLVVQMWNNGLHFTIYNKEKNKYVGLEAYNFKDIDNLGQLPSYLGKILNNRQSFAFPYENVYFIYQSRFSTLIPQPLYNEDNKNLYLGFNQPFQEESRILADSLTNTEAVNIYYMPNMVVEKVKDFWPNVKILHFSTALIETISINSRNKADLKTLFVNLRNDSFDIVHFKDNKLNYHNTFEFITKEDFIYFLLITIDQLGLNPEDTNVILSGNIEKTDDRYRMIHQYIKNYSFINRNENFLYSYILDEVKFHKYFTLFNALQCE